MRRLEQRLKDARRAGARLARVEDDRKLLEEGLDSLRALPPTEDSLAATRRAKEQLEKDQETLLAVADALRVVAENVEAFEWRDARGALATRQSVVETLRAQLDRANELKDQAQAALDKAETALSAASEKHQKAANKLGALDEALTRDRDELAEADVDDPSDAGLEAAAARAVELEKVVGKLDGEERKVGLEVVRQEGEAKRAADEVERLARELGDAERAWKPAHDRWESLRGLAEAQGLIAATLGEKYRARFAGSGSLNIWPQAKVHAGVLVERLKAARNGSELAERTRVAVEGADDATAAESYLQAWLLVREWLRGRVPTQIGEVAEPLEALARLREHLARLLDKLTQQERNLRGQSTDVARNIDTQVRRAKQQVLRLTRDLTGVGFGTVEGVQIRIQPVEEMDRVLRALREGETQQLLFDAELPSLEEAMEEIFRRYGGGRTGGQRLLDYREYVKVVVEVRRRGKRDWEIANPGEVGSTGEAIGVGAAVMMVVLAAWERDANLLRTKRSHGTLRLLFLDEATRLSQDNLIVLFQLCQSLDLQLLIAAPEVAHAEGNTTYRLVRKFDADGTEEVLVTGRRTISGARR